MALRNLESRTIRAALLSKPIKRRSTGGPVLFISVSGSENARSLGTERAAFPSVAFREKEPWRASIPADWSRTERGSPMKDGYRRGGRARSQAAAPSPALAAGSRPACLPLLLACGFCSAFRPSRARHRGTARADCSLNPWNETDNPPRPPDAPRLLLPPLFHPVSRVTCIELVSLGIVVTDTSRLFILVLDRLVGVPVLTAARGNGGTADFVGNFVLEAKG